mmetsp:Transcript_64851/g.89061  ORF Transcript_64851/g.89061 Transcript_64851/m.89061 type:complete len:121 (-) Transcript_64851:78-440(-)
MATKPPPPPPSSTYAGQDRAGQGDSRFDGGDAPPQSPPFSERWYVGRVERSVVTHIVGRWQGLMKDAEPLSSLMTPEGKHASSFISRVARGILARGDLSALLDEDWVSSLPWVQEQSPFT